METRQIYEERAAIGELATAYDEAAGKLSELQFEHIIYQGVLDQFPGATAKDFKKIYDDIVSEMSATERVARVMESLLKQAGLLSESYVDMSGQELLLAALQSKLSGEFDNFGSVLSEARTQADSYIEVLSSFYPNLKENTHLQDLFKATYALDPGVEQEIIDRIIALQDKVAAAGEYRAGKLVEAGDVVPSAGEVQDRIDELLKIWQLSEEQKIEYHARMLAKQGEMDADAAAQYIITETEKFRESKELEDLYHDLRFESYDDLARKKAEIDEQETARIKLVNESVVLSEQEKEDLISQIHAGAVAQRIRADEDAAEKTNEIVNQYQIAFNLSGDAARGFTNLMWNEGAKIEDMARQIGRSFTTNLVDVAMSAMFDLAASKEVDSAVTKLNTVALEENSAAVAVNTGAEKSLVVAEHAEIAASTEQMALSLSQVGALGAEGAAVATLTAEYYALAAAKAAANMMTGGGFGLIDLALGALPFGSVTGGGGSAGGGMIPSGLNTTLPSMAQAVVEKTEYNQTFIFSGNVMDEEYIRKTAVPQIERAATTNKSKLSTKNPVKTRSSNGIFS